MLQSFSKFLVFFGCHEDEDEEESTALKEIVLNFADFEKR